MWKGVYVAGGGEREEQECKALGGGIGHVDACEAWVGGERAGEG